jgi:hypothetical protein
LSTRAYRIGPLSLELSMPDGPLEAELDSSWGPFRGVPPGQTVKLAVTLREGEPGAAPPTMPRPLTLPGGESLLAGEGWQARISADGLAVALEQKAERFPLETTVKILLARALSKNGGMLLQGVAVAHGGGAAAFIGGPGQGKSTLAKMAALGGVPVLADGLVAVFPILGEWWAYGTPWETGAAWGAPLKALGLLAHGAAPSVSNADPADMLAVLGQSALLPDDGEATRVAHLCAVEQALGKVKAVRLTFAPDARVAQALMALCG